MAENYTVFLWLLKLGALVNIGLLISVGELSAGGARAPVIIPAQVLFAVSAYRCLFPVRYEDNIVFHDSVVSSVFVTRLLATFSEVAYVSLLAYVVRLLNVDQVGWVAALSWLMVLQVVVSQVLVWVAVLTEQFEFYFYEELGWAIIFAANAIASAYLYLTVGAFGGKRVLLLLNVLFGAAYLPWQVMHLRFLRANARRSRTNTGVGAQSIVQRLAAGLQRSIRVRNPRGDAESWGGLIGLTWMTAYWATVIPVWVYYIVRVLSTD
jgi:hypothetical protein